MDKIQIRGLKVFAWHGVGLEEKKKGQWFVLDVDMECDLKKAGSTDSLEDTVNYAAVVEKISQVMRKQSDDFIERAASSVAEAVLHMDDRICRVRVLLKKPEAPIQADFAYVAVEITRERKDFE